MTDTTQLKAGYYWVRWDEQGGWLIAEYDHGMWSVMGSLHCPKTSDFDEIDPNPMVRLNYPARAGEIAGQPEKSMATPGQIPTILVRDYCVTAEQMERLKAQPEEAPKQEPVAWPHLCNVCNGFVPMWGAPRLCGCHHHAPAGTHPAPASDELLEALEPLARLEVPKRTVGNAGAYSILHSDIRRAADVYAKNKGPQS